MKIIAVLIMIAIVATQEGTQQPPNVDSTNIPQNSAALGAETPPNMTPETTQQQPSPTQQPPSSPQSPSISKNTPDLEVATNSKTPPETPQSSPKPETVRPDVIQPVQTQTQPEISPPNMHDMSSLTDEQKAKLLEQERIRVQLHENKDLKLQDVVTVTQQQKQQREKRLKMESREAYQRVKRERLERIRIERMEEERIVADADQKVSRTKQINFKERRKVMTGKEEAKITHPEAFAHKAAQYKFELEPNTIEDFMIRLPVDHPIFLQASVYTNKDGVYTRTRDVNEEGPLKLRVLQNEYSLLSDTDFYFSQYIFFEGKANNTYKFNFINSEKHRLIIISLTNVVETGKVEKRMTTDEFDSIGVRATDLRANVKDKFWKIGELAVLEQTNRRTANEALSTYSWYMMLETIVVVALCLLQVESIRKMLTNQSIV